MAQLPGDARQLQYTATSGQTVFIYDFKIYDDDEVVVQSGSTTLTLTTHYTVQDAGEDAGGTITLVTGATAGDTITITGNSMVERDTTFTQGGDFNASAINGEYNKLDNIASELVTQAGGYFHLAVPTAATSKIVPAASTRKCLVWNTAATALENSVYDPDVMVAATAADVVLTNADVVLTHADVVLTNADVVSTNADVVTTNADAATTTADAATTTADAASTAADAVSTAADAVSTAADAVSTNADTISTGLDVATTNANVALTAADVVSTNADVLLTAADVISTAADAVSTAADVVLTNADVVTTNADVVLCDAAVATLNLTAVGSNIIADADSTRNLGSTGVRWANVWTDNINGAAPTSGRALFSADFAQSTDGGTYTTGSWMTRPINTEIYDDIGITLGTAGDANKLSVPAGKYMFHIGLVSMTTTDTMYRVYNDTDTAVIEYFSSIYVGSDEQWTNSTVYVNIAATKYITIEMSGSTTNADDGMGRASGLSVERYLNLYIERIGE